MNRRAFCACCGAAALAGCLSASGESAHPDNPYGSDTLTVGIDAEETGDPRADLVADALEYWDRHSEQYAGYPVTYDLAPDADDPDVEINWTDSVTVCGAEFNGMTLGCADYITEDVRVPSTVRVDAETGWTDETKRRVLIHELGHTLGLGHDDDPQEYMSVETPVIKDPIDVRVVWDALMVYDQDDVLEQIEHGLRYYEEWSREHMADDVTIGEISTSGVNVVSGGHGFVIRVDGDEDACGEGFVSCSTVQEADQLGTQFEATLARPPTEVIGWLVGDMFAGYLYLEGDEKPDVFDEFDYEHAASEWWLEDD